ncbi:hypothetical protein AVEN_185799-1, partial [Araneus ventricosus]
MLSGNTPPIQTGKTITLQENPTIGDVTNQRRGILYLGNAGQIRRTRSDKISIQNKRRCLLTSGVVILHDNT